MIVEPADPHPREAMNRSVTRSLGLLALVIAVVSSDARWHPQVHAQASPDRTPTALLIPAPTLSFGASADSNSPSTWGLVDGQLRLFVLTSFNGWPTRHVGSQLSALANRGAVSFAEPPPHGVWMESVIPDVDGTWYGYYHNELPAEVCDDDRRMLPRIGAARSFDQGATWEDLGVVLEAPRGWHDCDTTNRYFVGGVGDFSVVLDHDAQNLFFFFSQYVDRESTQGVAVARLAWADRDRPTGRISVWWRGATWVPSRRLRSESDRVEYTYPAGVPIYRAQDGWHEGQTVDAFWGPSVHWNTYLERWVMLLNRARDAEWRQEGIYVAFAKSLDDPTGWSTPQRLIAGGMWYPQVVGIENGSGTDKVGGERARLFMAGRSQYFIQFAR
jgi:hypothetical protein